MKKYLLFIFLIGSINHLKSQVNFIVLQPQSIKGGYNFTYNSPPTWGSPDLSIVANSITGSVVLAVDNTAADSLGCGDLVTDVAGKIALVYRGTCFHDEKALKAQEAGAIGIILINNGPGQMPQPSGVNPDLVTIPLTIISDVAGAAIREQLESGEDVQVFIGNSLGYFGNDLGISPKNMLIPSSTMLPTVLAENADEFNIDLGAWIYNFGFNDQTPSLNAKVILNGIELYSETSDAYTLLAGDSLYVSLPIFEETSYLEGTYELVYNVLGNTDELSFNNSISHKIILNDHKFALVKINAEGIPETVGGFRAGNNSSSNIFQSCLVFRNGHASRLAAEGLSFYASTPFGTDITGDYIEIRALEWNDEFTGLSDTNNFDVANITEKAFGFYDYAQNLQSVTVTANFEEPFVMEDNKRYLFCVSVFGADKFLGFDTNIDYEKNIQETDQPIMALFINEDYSPGFFPPAYPSIILNTLDASSIGLSENKKIESLPFPNPTNNIISIPFDGLEGNALLSITDGVGKIFSTQPMKILGNQPLKVNVDGFTKGIYYFNLEFENGARNNFKVVIN